MESKKENLSTVYTNKAKCRDCNRCVRHCPVKAIRIEKGQAQVIFEKCISCGTCVLECPQHAKTYQNDTEKVKILLKQGVSIALSLAPSFSGIFNEWEQKRLPSALRQLGFGFISETAVGAFHCAMLSRNVIENNTNKNHLLTACPAFVNYIEKYCPELVTSLVPISSPMIIHASILKEKLPRPTKIVFVGPCIAKKDEIKRKENQGLIDVVLTFEELDELMKWKNIDISKCEESNFDETPGLLSRTFPLEGGLLRTAGINPDLFSANIISVTGSDEINDIVSTLNNTNESYIIEPLFCKYGCINGPAIKRDKPKFAVRNKILEYTAINPGEKEEIQVNNSFVIPNFRAENLKYKTEFTEEEIQEVLKISGKTKPEDELNCGACGYNSCREKTTAVLQGIAETEMCVPYMKQLAESKNDLLLKTSPNGIVVLNDKLEILQMNFAFKKMFTCTDTILGKKISYLVDPDPFEKLSTGLETEVRKIIKYQNYNITCHQICYTVPDEKNYIGIFIDVTDLQSNKEKITEMKNETIVQAQELIEHQINMAQELARFLGENTAKGEMLMNNLIDAIKKD